MDPEIIAGGLKLLGGLFGRKQKQMSPAQSIMSTAQGVTDAAAATGLNRLTLLNASNATAGVGMTMGGPPPLASLSVLGDIIDENFSNDAKDRKEHNRLQNELLTLEVDRARSLNAVAPVQSVAGGGALNGGRGNMRVSGPSNGFLAETDRNPASAQEVDNTVSYQSHGQETVVPIGPDADEIFTGVFIEANNKRKARLAREARSPGMTTGAALSVPEGATSNGVGALLPLPSKKPDGKTADGRPFWVNPDGSIRYGSYPK